MAELAGAAEIAGGEAEIAGGEAEYAAEYAAGAECAGGAAEAVATTGCTAVTSPNNRTPAVTRVMLVRRLVTEITVTSDRSGVN